MDKIKMFWKRFMDGRNGVDECARTCLIAALFLYLAAYILNMGILHLLFWAAFIYGLFRVFSRDRDQRLKENLKFLSYVQLIKMNFQQRKTHRIFMCSRCGKMVRVPKGKGKIEITCPVCGNKMIHRTQIQDSSVNSIEKGQDGNTVSNYEEA